MCFWEYENKLSVGSKPPPLLSRQDLHLSPLRSPKSVNIWNCILPSQKNLNFYIKGKSRGWHILELWPWGCLNLTPFPFFLSHVLDPLLTAFICSLVCCWSLLTLYLSTCLLLSVPSQVLSCIFYWIQLLLIPESALYWPHFGYSSSSTVL